MSLVFFNKHILPCMASGLSGSVFTWMIFDCKAHNERVAAAAKKIDVAGSAWIHVAPISRINSSHVSPSYSEGNQ
jgi:hypothetical protein